MDFIIEFIGELIFEGLVEIIKSKKVPKIIRFIVFLVVFVFYALIIGMLGVVSAHLIFDRRYLVGILVGILTFIIFLMFFFFLRSLRKTDVDE